MRARAVILALLFTAATPAQTLHRIDGSTLSPARARAIVDSELTRDHVTGAQIALLHNGRTAWTYADGASRSSAIPSTIRKRRAESASSTSRRNIATKAFAKLLRASGGP